MTVPNPTTASRPLPPTASPLFLREDEIRRGIELLYFGYSSMIRGADAILDREGFGRAHHRALYFIARRPGLPVGDLLRLLAITKQSLGRVLTELQSRSLVEQAIGTTDRRQRLLRLTPAGTALEASLFAELETGMASAYGEAGQSAVTGFWSVLIGLIPAQDRALVESLRQG
ncbi:MarR family transcriptional regulator [Polymorphobacter glacialis]|uniref:MarR family transcriptional regulator n=1 Tax=Sandarakinorhabdus glacialis TaxID=1614636 RepID=A0A916ZLC4_9SPHN|nr:MarR family transcriptional regulator [Polymorphobacter glacialis]GGE02112.1 MarR family transcriptional regulator [Polymorphobacter glacialis]